MRKSVGLSLLAIALAAIVILLVSRAPAPSFTALTKVTVATSTITASTTDYTVEAAYPQFGISAIDTQIKQWVRGGISDVQTRAAQDKPAANNFPTYDFTSDFSETYIGADFISTRLLLSEYLGGAHEQPTIIGATFHRESGKAVTLDEALALTGKTLAQVAAEAKRQLGRNQYTQPTGIWASGSDPIPDNYQTFLINKDSVIFIFQPYQVAPYSSGAPEVSISRIK